MKSIGAPSQYPEFVPPLTPCNTPVRRCGVPREAATQRILIMRVGAHGDILMGTPLLRALRERLPNAHLTWIVERSAREAIDASPFIDEVLLWDSRYWKRMLRRGLYPLWLARALRFRAQLRRRRYDIFLSYQPEEWPLLVRGVKATIRIGVFDTLRTWSGATRTSPNTRLYTTAYTHEDLPPHRTDQYLLPLRALGIPEPAPTDKRMTLGYTEEDAAAVEDFLRECGAADADARSRLIAIAPMTTWASRCWPGERYAALADALAQSEPGCQVVLLGSTGEKRAIQEIAARMRTKPVLAAGVFGFRQMAALIDRAALLVSGDTGPMHVASAVGTPYLALFGPTPIAGRVPIVGRGLPLAHPVPCGPCDRDRCANTGDNHLLCMRLLTVNEVYEAARRLLNDGAQKPERVAHAR